MYFSPYAAILEELKSNTLHITETSSNMNKFCRNQYNKKTKEKPGVFAMMKYRTTKKLK